MQNVRFTRVTVQIDFLQLWKEKRVEMIVDKVFVAPIKVHAKRVGKRCIARKVALVRQSDKMNFGNAFEHRVRIHS